MEALCIGHVAYDVFLPVTGYPAENSKTMIPESFESSGGPACNAACLMAKWGMQCGIAGVVGQDPYGMHICSELAAWGVDTRFLEKREGYGTVLSCIIVNEENGSRTIITRRKPNSCLSAALDFSDLSPKVLLFDGHEPDASLSAMKAFPKAATILDAGSLREGTELLAGVVDFCIASEKFAREISGLSDLKDEGSILKALSVLMAKNGKQVAITLGERGYAYLQNGTLKTAAAIPVRAQDTTAAGDIFHGAFAYAYAQGKTFEASLAIANAAAGISVTRKGGKASIPSLEEVLTVVSG